MSLMSKNAAKIAALCLLAVFLFHSRVLAAGGEGGTDGGAKILLSLFIVFVAAQIGAEIAQRLQMPGVVGEIAAGCVIGPAALNWVQINEPLHVLAEIGAVLLLFSVGLETRVGDLKKVGRVATQVGTLGLILPFILATGWALQRGADVPKSLFVAAAFVATSAGITARVLNDMGVLGRIESRVILGAAVIDDILAMLLLGVVTALSKGEGVDILTLGLVTVQAIGFVGLIALVGTRIAAKRGTEILDAPISPFSHLTIALAFCLGLAAAAAFLGLAAIIGAFLAGMVAAETRQRHQLEKQVQVLMALLVPFFFVVTGAQVQLKELANWSTIGTLLLVTILAIIGKLVGCGLGAKSLGKRSAMIVGVGMVPRGEVGIIVATLGYNSKIFTSELYSIIIAMSLLTSVVAPPALKILFSGIEPDPDEESEEPFSSLIPVDMTGFDSRNP